MRFTETDLKAYARNLITYTNGQYKFQIEKNNGNYEIYINEIENEIRNGKLIKGGLTIREAQAFIQGYLQGLKFQKELIIYKLGLN